MHPPGAGGGTGSAGVVGWGAVSVAFAGSGGLPVDRNDSGELSVLDISGVPAVPGLPEVPGVPGLPDVPGVPELPDVPGVPGLPLTDAPGLDSPSAPVLLVPELPLHSPAQAVEVPSAPRAPDPGCP